MSDPRSVRLEELTWQEIREYIGTDPAPTVLIPIGSTEQHGPHLPVGTDAYEAEALAGAVAEAAGVLVAPTIPYGDADHHLGFPGTVSLTTDTVVSVLGDVYTSLAGHGFEHVVTVNGHRVANLPAIETAMRRVDPEHPETGFAAIDLLRIGAEVHRELRTGDPEDGMHGGEFETSLMQFHRPELVREDAIEPETHATGSRFVTNDLVSAADRAITPPGRHDPDAGDLGHVGDPTHANPSKGETLHDRLVENSVEFIEDLRSTG